MSQPMYMGILWEIILACVAAGVEGDQCKARAAAEVLLEHVKKGGETRVAESIQRILDGRKGSRLVFLAQEAQEPHAS